MFNKLQLYLTEIYFEMKQCKEDQLNEIDSMIAGLESKSIEKSASKIKVELERRKEFDAKFDSVAQTLDKLAILET